MTTTAPAAVAAATAIPPMPAYAPTVAQATQIQQGSAALKIEPAPMPEPVPAPAAIETVVEAAPMPAPVAAAPAAEAFIPPRPVEVAPTAAAPAQPANPFAEAEMVNAAKTTAAKPARRSTLFERMTRTGMARVEAEASRSQPTLVPPVGGIMPTAAAPVTATPAPAPAPTPAPQAAAQPRLGGLDPTDRIQPKSEDDLLEIPAFLRRQAN